MAPPRKSGRENACPPPETLNAWTLPAELILEIVARSDHRTLIRIAATCNLLRCEIRSPSFIHRISQATPRILTYLCTDADKPLILVHPATPSATFFCLDHLSPFISCRTADIFDLYSPIMSRHGLVLLERQNIHNGSKSNRCFHLCVYDPMSGARTFFSRPPKIKISQSSRHRYVLLTAIDGINEPFLLLVVDLYGWGIKVQAGSWCGTWGPVKYGSDHDLPWWTLKRRGDPAVLQGGIIHWLACHSHTNKILSYDLDTGKSRSVKLPSTNCNIYQLHLATSSDGKRLKLLGVKGFVISVWLQHPISTSCGDGWVLETTIDMEEKLRSLDPCNPFEGTYKFIVLHCVEKRSGDVLLLRVHGQGYIYDAIVDLETKDMHRQELGPFLLEIESGEHENLFLASIPCK